MVIIQFMVLLLSPTIPCKPNDLLTLSDPGFLDTLNTWGGQILPAGKRWSLMASEATAEAKKRKNIVPDIFLYL